MNENIKDSNVKTMIKKNRLNQNFGQNNSMLKIAD